MVGRRAKGRKKIGSKAAKTSRGRSSKAKKTSKARKPSKAAKRKTARKQAPARKKATRKAASRVSGRGRKEVLGEGNYTASREFRREETGFVRRNRNRIPELGKQAAEALDGSEGNELRQAEDTARSRSAGTNED